MAQESVRWFLRQPAVGEQISTAAGTMVLFLIAMFVLFIEGLISIADAAGLHVGRLRVRGFSPLDLEADQASR